MALYETTFIARQDISSQDVNKLIDTFSDILLQNGGKVVKHEYWGLKNLAYIIKKNRKGHYVMFVIDSPYEAVKEMERRMGINEDIMRFMTVRIESISDEPSPMINNRATEENFDIELDEVFNEGEE